jgi:hypothetical protein
MNLAKATRKPIHRKGAKSAKVKRMCVAAFIPEEPGSISSSAFWITALRRNVGLKPVEVLSP